MNLTTVTITGADDSTNIDDLVRLSHLYPFVEWGILVSKKQQGGYRFPSNQWIEEFTYFADINKLKVSMHVCGKWVRDMLVGELDWLDLPCVEEVCQRIQINTHTEPHVVTTGLLRSLDLNKDKDFIFQWDGINNLLTYSALAYGYKVSALFDSSGGRGELPASWPEPCKDFVCGYAGGIGPYNVMDQIKLINKVCKKPYWIDMERRVRTDDDTMLDITAVTSVLKQVQQYYNENN